MVGGRLTLEKNIVRGSLIKAIKILAEHLPDGFVPDPVSTSTLQRLKTWCEQFDADDCRYRLSPLWMFSLYPRTTMPDRDDPSDQN
jgi:hypothetical protein